MTSRSIMTSIRLERHLNQKLETAARDLHRKKNWLISEALRLYLDSIGNTNLAEEASKQSLLASKHSDSEIDLWEINHSQEGWNV